mmetsp:Transcript_39486/g.29162  ORF Transcript_39486/g.29162 Transcript_39486/m.29162 type:complete len:85 (+) Transcript_39486:1956-2210(+)
MANCPRTTKICWSTEWLSDHQEGVITALLQTKKDLISNWPKDGMETYLDMERLSVKSCSKEVDELKRMLTSAKPEISFFDSEHL